MVEATPVTGSLLSSLAVALLCGLIVGFERGWQQREEDAAPPDARQRSAGIRTFALAGLLGGVIASLGEAFGGTPWLLGSALLALAGLVALAWLTRLREGGDVGLTTELALLVTFLLGALAGAGQWLEAASAAVVTALLLGFKAELHGALGRLNRQEVRASLQLLLIAVVIVPLLPDRQLGPFDALNPRTTGLLVLLVAGISFVGYFAVRMFGARIGLMFTAAFGGLTSSTAVTLGFARLARRGDLPPRLLAGGIVLACAIMGPRLALEVAAVNRSLLPALLPGVAALTLVPAFGSLWLARSEGAPARSAAVTDELADAVPVENPLELRQACVLAALIALVFVLAAGARELLGDRGVYVLAALSGFMDVDAIALTLSEQARGALAPATAVRAILLAALVNDLVKAALAVLVGGRALARSVAPLLVATALITAATLPFVE